MNNRKIGVIGGMGPMASQLFYKMVTEKTDAAKDQEHLSMVILSDASMPDRTGAILSGDIDDVYNKMLEDARQLEKMGCEAVAITCNTAHYFADMIEPKLDIPIIHMIRETAKVATAGGNKKIAILATDGTIKTQLYQKQLIKEGAEPYILSPGNQREVMHQIYDCIKTGKPYDRKSWEKIEKEVLAEGCHKALLACTELSVIKADNGLSDEIYIDPMEVLAEKVVLFSGHTLKENMSQFSNILGQ